MKFPYLVRAIGTQLSLLQINEIQYRYVIKAMVFKSLASICKTLPCLFKFYHPCKSISYDTQFWSTANLKISNFLNWNFTGFYFWNFAINTKEKGIEKLHDCFIKFNISLLKNSSVATKKILETSPTSKIWDLLTAICLSKLSWVSDKNIF